MARVELYLTDDKGVKITQLTTGLALSASKVVSDYGWLSYKPSRSFDYSLLRPDRQIQLWYEPTGGDLFLWNVYLLRKWSFRHLETTLTCPDVMDFLRRRHVIAYSGTAQTKKTGPADDMMKEVMTESLANGVAPTPIAGTRVWSNFSVRADDSLGPSITQSFALDKLLTSSGEGVMRQIANSAAAAGTPVYFFVVPKLSPNGIEFEFITSVGLPGPDVSDDVVFSLEDGNLQDPELEYDYTEEENYIYAAGQGEDDDRAFEQLYDVNAYSQSIWGRIEGVADCRNSDSDSLEAAGNAYLSSAKPKIRFRGKPIDTKGTRFGKHWDVGNTCKAKYKGIELNFVVRAASISVDGNGKVDIQTRFDYES